ncbi:MAG: efflux RND transporter periplasmic adaptor subunit, partial [Pseudomonadota bacterium]
MRFLSVITAIIVMATMYMLVFEREAVVAFAAGSAPEEAAPDADSEAAAAPPEAERVSVVALSSKADVVDQVVLVRGRTEA